MKSVILKRFVRQCPLIVVFSLGLTLFVLVHFPHKVLGSQFLYEDDREVVEVKAVTGSFQTSTKPRVIAFYSPYCVSDHRPCYNSSPNLEATSTLFPNLDIANVLI